MAGRYSSSGGGPNDLRPVCRDQPEPAAGRNLWDLFSIDEVPGDAAQPLPAPITERALEEHLQRHWERTEFARLGIALANPDKHGWPCRQVLTPRNTIDLLGYREAANEWWVGTGLVQRTQPSIGT